MATKPTISIGLKHKDLFKEPILEIGSLMHDSYTQETPRSIHEQASHYVGIDIFPGNGVDHVINLCDSKQIPEEWTKNGGYFNTIHCHCVLEHVVNIFSMAENISKISKEGAMLYITVPFAWKIHRIPLDMWRFTPQSIDFLFSKFEFNKEHCYFTTRKGEIFTIDHVPEINLSKGLHDMNWLLRLFIKTFRKLKLDDGIFQNRALYPEINLSMIGCKKNTDTYTFIDKKHHSLLYT